MQPVSLVATKDFLAAVHHFSVAATMLVAATMTYEPFCAERLREALSDLAGCFDLEWAAETWPEVTSEGGRLTQALWCPTLLLTRETERAVLCWRPPPEAPGSVPAGFEVFLAA